MSFALKYIGPLSITPIISLTGFSLIPVGYDLASGQWWIALMTMFIVLLFSQYLKTNTIPNRPCSSIKNMKLSVFACLNFFPVLLAMTIACTLCAIFTIYDVLPKEADQWGHLARMDRNIRVMHEAKWFRFPYPGQWGRPTVSVASVFGMLAGVIAAMLESVGDYHACARVSGAPAPPAHALNRGIFVEGIACVLAGAWGSGNGTTSFSENIGVIGITKVGSRRVVQVGGCIMLILGCFGKFAAIFTLIPAPVFGGLCLITFGMIIAVGLSNLQYVDLNSSRNLCVLGVSLFFGLCVPFWIDKNYQTINTGNAVVDQILTVLLRTNMFVGGCVAFILDNSITGTDRERGISSWRDSSLENLSKLPQEIRVYNPPFYELILSKAPFIKWLPIFPNPDMRSS